MSISERCSTYFGRVVLMVLLTFIMIMASGKTKAFAGTMISPKDGEEIHGLNQTVSFEIKSGYSSNRQDYMKVTIKDPDGDIVYSQDFKYDGTNAIISGSFIPEKEGKYTISNYTWYYIENYFLVNGIQKIQTFPSASTDTKTSTFTILKQEFTLSTDNKDKITLSLPKTDASGYEIYRSTSKTGKFKKVGATTKTTYNDKKLSQGTYYYKVREYTDKNGKKKYGKYSSVKSISCDAKNITTELSLTQVKKKVSLNFGGEKADGYEVYRADSKKGTYKKLTTTTKTAYTDSSVKKTKTYYYKVRAYVKVGKTTYYGKYSSVQNITVADLDSVSLKGYPYLDDDGYWHYKMMLNGNFIPIRADALLATKDNEETEVLYPVSAILDCYGVSYYWNKGTGEFSTKVNGVETSRDPEDGTYMWFSSYVTGRGSSIMPMEINGVWYAPAYFFEETIGATLDKVTKGKEKNQKYITITTGDFKWGKGSKTVKIRHWDLSKEKYIY